jgi:excisionase family DNA binding protein
MPNADVFDTEQAAQLLRCSVDTVRDRADAGELPGLKYGRDWVFPREALLEAVNELARAEAAKRRGRPAARPAAVAQIASGRRRPPALPSDA